MVTRVMGEPVASERTFVSGDEVRRDFDVDAEASPYITVDIFDGKVLECTDASKRICTVEGRVYAFDAPQFDTLDEVVKLLEICIERYAAPELSDGPVTAFVSLCSIDTVVPFARIDADVDNGHAYATLHFEDGSQQSVRRVAVDPTDDVMMLIHRIVRHARSKSTNSCAAEN